ncbi:MAG: hypothetical protein NWF09_06605 [Candidatus Bathyarchaeota archaeon]|nr:hypothetical protein [Candidatus Bathyarchaeota archaeon]
MAKTGAFIVAAMASAMRFVFPVLEKYKIQGFIIAYYAALA